MSENCPDMFPAYVFSGCVRSLERKGLVKGAYESGGNVIAARLTKEGGCYLAEYPELKNPINWAALGAIIALITLIVMIIGLFIACSKI